MLQTHWAFWRVLESDVFSRWTRVAAGSVDRAVKLWDLTSGDCVQSLEGHSWYVYSVSFSPDGTKVASGSRDDVKLWNLTRVSVYIHSRGILIL